MFPLRFVPSVVRPGHGGALTRKYVAWLFPVMALIAFLILSPARAETNDVAAVDLELVASGFAAPAVLAEAPDGSGRIFIADQTGVIYVLMPDGTLRDEPFLDLRPNMVPLNGNYDERGLLGFAFHPNFADNQTVYVYYSAPLRAGAPAGYNHTARVAEFRVAENDPNRIDPSTEQVIIEIDQPYSNHNGGAIAFSLDGYLYIALGDGGGANDTGLHNPPQGFAQDTTTLLGKILRLEVIPGQPGYRIPVDNPFADSDAGRGEIWAWGFRNPFRIAFDTGEHGHLFVADVGQNRWEEISIATHPGNYGWRAREGVERFNPPPGSADQLLIDPVVVYPNTTAFGIQNGAGTSVTGAYIYRGEAIPELRGKLVFSDWTLQGGRPAGRVYVATPPADWEAAWEDAPATDGELWPWEVLLTTEFFVRTIARDASGELYLLVNQRQGPSGNTGAVYKLVPAN